VVCWSTKAAIDLSLKHVQSVQIEEKLLCRAYGKSTTLFQTVGLPSPTLYGLLFPKLGVRNPAPKLQSLLSQARMKLRTSNMAGTFTGKNGAWAYPGTPHIWGPTWAIWSYGNTPQNRVGSGAQKPCWGQCEQIP